VTGGQSSAAARLRLAFVRVRMKAMWNVRVANGLKASFKQSDGSSRPGHDWIITITNGSREHRAMIRTYADRFPSFSDTDFANAAIQFVQQQLANGWNPSVTDEPPQSQVPDEFLASLAHTPESGSRTDIQSKGSWWQFWK
jgi:hypothetical protein